MSHDDNATVDVLVLGSGCAGMVTALAAADADATVALHEKAELLGGTTALSSGVAWLPANKYQAEHGVEDSIEDGRAYLTALSNGMILPEFTEAFLATVEPMLEWTEQRTPLQMRLVPGYPDYHPEFPGGKPGGGRSTEPSLFSFHDLGEWSDRFLGSRRSMYVGETPVGGGTGFLTPEVEQERAGERLEGLGRGMLGALLKGLLDHGVEVTTSSRATGLLVEDGRVVGARFEGGAEVRARRGVVLATGGFERDPELVRDFLRGPLRHAPGAPTNTGDGLRMAMRVGAQLGVMREAWWVPVVTIPGFEGEQYSAHGVQLVQRERTLAAHHHGQRPGAGASPTRPPTTTPSAAPSTSSTRPGSATRTSPPGSSSTRASPTSTAATASRRASQVPDWIDRADSVAELAERLGLPADELSATIERWNELCALGRDLDHGRGESAYDGWCGDRAHYPTPQATLGPIDRPPFYASPVHSSALGTKGGPRTTVDCEVLDVDGGVIPGLWAVGNVMAAPTGMVYGGAGGTLGPAMVFGYRAGRSVAGMDM